MALFPFAMGTLVFNFFAIENNMTQRHIIFAVILTAFVCLSLGSMGSFAAYWFSQAQTYKYYVGDLHALIDMHEGKSVKTVLAPSSPKKGLLNDPQ